MRGRRGEVGQAAVELALALPVVALLLLAVVQVGQVVAAQVAVVQAARDGARQAAVDPDPAAVRAAATQGLGPDGVTVDVVTAPGPAGGRTVAVTVHRRTPTDIPLIGPLVPDVDLEATVTALAG